MKNIIIMSLILSFHISAVLSKHDFKNKHKKEIQHDDTVKKISFKVSDNIDEFLQNVEKVSSQSLDEYFKHAKDNIKHAKSVYKVLKDFFNSCNNTNSFESFINNASEAILNKNQKDSILENLNNLNKNMRQEHTIDFKKKWICGNLEFKSVSLMDELKKYLDQQYHSFKRTVASDLKTNIQSFYVREINHASSLADIQDLQLLLTGLLEKATAEINLKTFLDYFNNEILNTTKSDLISKYKMLQGFIDEIPEKDRVNYKSKQKWMDVDTLYLLNNMIVELYKYSKEIESTYNDTDGVFTYTGYFGKISKVVKQIKDAVDIKNLTRIAIYTTHSVLFDSDFYVDRRKFVNDAPDLVIVAPRVIAELPVAVYLSTQYHPPYPDEKKKAKDGANFGDKGEDGKPGFNGYNSGNLAIECENTFNLNNLKFISKGGLGGPGQHGGNGKEGAKGITPLESSITKNDPFDHEEIGSSSKLADIKIRYHRKEGTAGSRGGDAGKGGCGGQGGNGGKFSLKTPTDFFEIKTAETGANGPNGISGKPGLGGQYGDTVLKATSCDYYVTIRGAFCADTPLGKMICLGALNKEKNAVCNHNLTKIRESELRGESGNFPSGLDCIKGPEKDIKDEINFGQVENEYLEFLKKADDEFNISELLAHNFINKNIQKQDA